MILKKVYTKLSTEDSGKKIGLFRIITAIFGGLISSYLMMAALALIIPSRIADTSVLAILFNTLAWASMMLWISLSDTKLNALLKFLIPTIISSIIIYILN